jgi:manganese transport protein
MAEPPVAAAAGEARAAEPSLPEAFRTVEVPSTGLARKLVAFIGPGFLVAVGYMDPGNWATDLAAGSAFGYRLLAVVLLSSIMAILLQALAARLGIATGADLAQACRRYFSPPVNRVLWVLAEIGICACDLAELLGTALGLKLLFGIPLFIGVCLTCVDVLLILALQRYGFRKLESFVIALMAVIVLCFAAQLALASPDLGEVARGFVPTTPIVTDPAMLYVAIGILGATVMPHNLYLHSSIIQTRRYPLTPAGRREAARFATLESSVTLTLAMFINAAILILAAATFHAGGYGEVAEIADAHQMLTPLLGPAAAMLFAVALLASGQNASITATLAGQIVMEGFVRLRLAPWKRRLVTRAIAATPAILVVGIQGESGVGELLILSQVILSFQLPFAVVPLVAFTADRRKMGELASPRAVTVAAWAVAALIVLLNVTLLVQILIL